MRLPGRDQKYILFIDLKNAYDSVNHVRLFNKMRKYNAPEKLVNTIAKIYSYAKMKVNLNLPAMNVNRGVLQGSILSPMLFNIFINDLIDLLDKNVFEVLAYADDIAVICKDKEELIKAMKLIDQWANENYILINKKKSGILVLCNPTNRDTAIEGYPLKNQYKYLGVTLNSYIDPSNHIFNVNRKLSDYIKRNEWLLKSYFSPKSLLLLANYYQMSRLSYGMCIFIDVKEIMESLEKARVKYFRSILGCKDNIKSNLLRLVFCLPRMEYLLFNRLLNVIEKYKYHFNENPYIFYDIVEAFNKRTNANKIKNIEHRYEQIKWCIIKATAKEENIEINREYMNVSQKNYYRYPDRRDIFVSRFFMNYGFFEKRLFPKCKYCGRENSRTHVVNECEYEFFKELREEYKKKIIKLISDKKNRGDNNANNNLNIVDFNLEKALLDLYFKPTKEIKIYKSLELIKEFTAKFYIERPREDNMEDIQIEDIGENNKRRYIRNDDDIKELKE